MFKKLLCAASIVAMASTSVSASGILLPGGVSIPNPVAANPATGTGNLLNSLGFIQYFEDSNGDFVNLGDILNGSGAIDPQSALDLSLNGFGLLDSSGDAGEFLCASCSLTLEFGGLDVVATQIVNPFNPTGPLVDTFTVDATNSFINVFISGPKDPSFAVGPSLAPAGVLDQVAADDFIDEANDTLFLSGVFSELTYDPTISAQNLLAGGLLQGTLTAGIELDDPLLPTSGVANGNFVSDSVTQSNLSNLFDAVAFSLSANFVSVTGSILDIAQGNDGNLSANVVPAPATLGLFGLSLLAAARMRRRS